mmetsp:Transcript_45680/g.55419  ORF Transcript_45680/g.55419 Transcript_45680/m.55419 type:complete len:675 (+) Transcript_45680:290-2314(+)
MLQHSVNNTIKCIALLALFQNCQPNNLHLFVTAAKDDNTAIATTDFIIDTTSPSNNNNNNNTSNTATTITPRRFLRFDPKTVTYKHPPTITTTSDSRTERFDQDSVIAIINTPKCGTGGMYSHFSESYNCHFRRTKMDGVYVAPCTEPKGIDIIKSHQHEHAIHFLRDRYLWGRINEPVQKRCLIVTAVRDPRTWLPSKFMEDEKRRYCEAGREDITPAQAVGHYREWLERTAELNRHRAQWNVPHFLKMYGTTLTEQMNVFRENGGYSLLPPVSLEQAQQGRKLSEEEDGSGPPPIETSCSLLFLHFEQAQRWPDIFKAVSPGVDYTAPEDRNQLCPDNVDRYNAIKNYELTDEEKHAFIGHDQYSPYLEEWFRVYGYLTSSSRSSFFYKGNKGLQITRYNTDSVIAVINTPKCGTGGMYKHFADSYDCTFERTMFDGVMIGPCKRPNSIDVIRSHNHENSLLMLRMYLLDNLKQKQQKKCLILTAVRDPKTWFPSKFMEDEKKKYCEATDITPEQAVEDYRDWLVYANNRNRHRAQWNIPHFLKLYGTTLKEQMKVLEENRGYSLLPPVPPPESSLRDNSSVQDVPVQSHCSLLFLQVEHGDKWPEVFQNLSPGPEYKAPEDRNNLCPNNKERNAAIKKYELTEREKRFFIGQNDEYSDFIEEWFRVYGYIN